ncbi:class I SAM-dependent methyltransferase [Cupriavidus sp. RAF12]|uniref:class I SAM-dependent methyltransferase n=1 Tax=Cupriavidus sp. RAF12 TaxID=3233050 RepID=UPI003F934A12
MSIDDARQCPDASSPLARFAHRSRIALGLDMVAARCPQGGTVVDVGAGPGLFLHWLGEARPDLTLAGLDPGKAPDYPEIRHVSSMSELANASVDVLTAFEVCEHLYPNEIAAFLNDSARILRPGGSLVISVPVMYGMAIVPKLLDGMVSNRSLRMDHTPVEALRALLGLPVTRPDNPRQTHKGFDFRKLRAHVCTRFAVEFACNSPLPQLPWWLSSQYFMVCRTRPAVRHARR